ncbi:MAG: hypothetical protein E3J47_06210 [Candidatus Stahlbacteria bacterium]|nr:MAG: hypothetical protein E3J47_06210 [Candidatus Stahlbacteria bacterium]
MKKYLILLLLIIPSFIFAQNYGIGVIIGSPTGFTGKYLWSRNSAIVVNAGWSFVSDVKFHITGDYQFLFPGVIKGEEGVALRNVVPYLGIGGSFRAKTDEATDETDFCIGLRLGGGIEYLISRFGVFLELYPVVNVIPSTDFDLEGGLGFRFYF